ncbi:MAG: hypothetical protein ACTSSF_13190 [Candidatus Heimdallarchaeaceae archaeon]
MTKDGEYISEIVLFKKNVVVDIKDLEIAWFVSAIEEDKYVH